MEEFGILGKEIKMMVKQTRKPLIIQSTNKLNYTYL
jgi:hypothetical protein